jgi:hypothetical protein
MTLEEFIKNSLCKSGIQDATGVELTFSDGRKLTIHSDNHPALKESTVVTGEPVVKPVQSAQGGL